MALPNNKASNTSEAQEVRQDRDSTAATAAGYIATIGVVAVSMVITIVWHLGTAGDFLLAAAALGMLVQTSHTIGIWAGLTLLVTTSLALVFQNDLLAERFANLAYYGFGVGGLWAIWNIIVVRNNWQMPVVALRHYLYKKRFYRQVRAPLVVIMVVLFGATIILLGDVGFAGSILVSGAVLGVIARLPYLIPLWSGLTLAVVALLLFIGGDHGLAINAVFLSCGALATSMVWLGWNRIRGRLTW